MARLAGPGGRQRRREGAGAPRHVPCGGSKRQTDDCCVFPNWICRNDTHCHHNSKDGRWMKAFVFAQKSAKRSVSFLVEAQKKEKGSNEQRLFFRRSFCISVIMSQQFILSFFVLAPTHNVDGRVALLLPALSNTQPKRCCNHQALKDAGVPPPWMRLYTP